MIIPVELKWVAFFLFSAVLAYISRASLRRTQAHGFYRFLAWEAITALILLNLDTWFVDPFQWNQMLSWLFLLASIFMVIHSMTLLRQRGKPAANRAGGEALIGFEKTTRLVTTGAYRYIRHPMYSSLVYLAIGAFFKAPGLLGLALTLTTLYCLNATAQKEELENLSFFGPEYAAYMRQTRRFIPYLY